MKTVFVVKREYDREGFHIAGIFYTKDEAEAALKKDEEHGYGVSHSIAELEVGRWFDITEPGGQ